MVSTEVVPLKEGFGDLTAEEGREGEEGQLETRENGGRRRERERADLPHPRSITANEVAFSLSSESDPSYRTFPSASYHRLSQTQKLKNERTKQRRRGIEI